MVKITAPASDELTGIGYLVIEAEKLLRSGTISSNDDSAAADMVIRSQPAWKIPSHLRVRYYAEVLKILTRRRNARKKDQNQKRSAVRAEMPHRRVGNACARSAIAQEEAEERNYRNFQESPAVPEQPLKNLQPKHSEQLELF